MATAYEWLGQGDTGGDWMDSNGIYFGPVLFLYGNGITAAITGQSDTDYTSQILALLDSGNILVLTEPTFITIFGNLIQSNPHVRV